MDIDKAIWILIDFGNRTTNSDFISAMNTVIAEFRRLQNKEKIKYSGLDDDYVSKKELRHDLEVIKKIAKTDNMPQFWIKRGIEVYLEKMLEVKDV